MKIKKSILEKMALPSLTKKGQEVLVWSVDPASKPLSVWQVAKSLPNGVILQNNDGTDTMSMTTEEFAQMARMGDLRTMLTHFVEAAQYIAMKHDMAITGLETDSASSGSDSDEDEEADAFSVNDTAYVHIGRRSRIPANLFFNGPRIYGVLKYMKQRWSRRLNGYSPRKWKLLTWDSTGKSYTFKAAQARLTKCDTKDLPQWVAKEARSCGWIQ